ncbi:MAG: hypothetical protein Q4F72_01145 [Desulfovibrionaceae bacterium]|nr:hypothetical protein [Desulfovibrionaceae bacterium]
MKKTLVCVDNLDEFICSKCGSFYQRSGMILTAGAKDELVRRGIRLQYGEPPAGSCCAGSPCPEAEAACPNKSCRAAQAHGGAMEIADLARVNSLEDLLGELAGMIESNCQVRDRDKLHEASLKALQAIRNNI